MRFSLLAPALSLTVTALAGAQSQSPATASSSTSSSTSASAGAIGVGQATTAPYAAIRAPASAFTSSLTSPFTSAVASAASGTGEATSWADAPDRQRSMPPVAAPTFRPYVSEHIADAADSLYRLARAALDDGDFRRAAMLFATVSDRFPDSSIAADALYYRAYALYRSGTSRELDDAVKSIDRQAARYPKAGTTSDAKQLRASILSEQAKRGDTRAVQEISQGGSTLQNEKRCPTDDDDMRLAALMGIMQIDPDQVLPVLQKVLARRDDCSVNLRRRAVLMIAQTKEEERADILLNVARTDPSIEVRREAVLYLSRVNTERAAKALDSILTYATDNELRERALSALSQHTSPSARMALRHFAEQPTIPTDLRVRAVSYMANGRKSGDESEYFRALFNKTASAELREALIRAVASQRTPDRTSWMLGIARDRSYEVEVRKQALFHAGQTNPDLKELLPLYEEFAGQPEMQDQMLYVYQQRKEPEATDKLLQIAKTEKNPELRKSAVRWLGTRKDPRVKQFLLDLISQ